MEVTRVHCRGRQTEKASEGQQRETVGREENLIKRGEKRYTKFKRRFYEDKKAERNDTKGG